MALNPEDAQFEISPGRMVGYGHPCYIIAEIGQNHQGDASIAKEMMKAAASAGASAVKFQKSTIEDRYNKKCLVRPYDTPNSWGKTYGEHKRYLELSEESYKELRQYADELGVDFSASGFDNKAIDFLDSGINCPWIKVASTDVGNLDFIDYIARKMKPMVISSGMQDLDTMRRVYKTVKHYHSNFTFLQCTSAYPVCAENVNLRVIQTYKETFPDVVPGYSGHETGTAISLGAVALGAKVLERHVTLNKTWRGSDHGASLDMGELADLVKQIRTLELAMGSPEKRMLDVEGPLKRKLGKSAVAVGGLPKGTVIEKRHITVKNAEPCGVPPHELHKIIGSVLTRDIEHDETIQENDVEKNSLQEEKRKFACVILARKGSKGIPQKNIKLLNGQPLIAWSILAAKKAACFDEIWVSTDSAEIGAIAESFGAKYHDRDPASAEDTASSKDALLEFLSHHKDVWAVGMLQCTFPTQDPNMIVEAVNKIKSEQSDCVFAVCRSHKFRWTPMTSPEDWTRPMNFNNFSRPRRQDWSGELVETGAFYMFRVQQFLNTGNYQSGHLSYLVDENTDDYVDIDTPADFAKASILIQKHSDKFGLDQVMPPAQSGHVKKDSQLIN